MEKAVFLGGLFYSPIFITSLSLDTDFFVLLTI